MTEPHDHDDVRRMVDTDPSVEGIVRDRTGLEKPVTYSGTANPADRFCELCTYAQTAGFIAPEYQGGTAVCTTHARALVSGDWEYGDTFEVVPIRKAVP